MGGFLKQSTASQTRTLGPFIDDADFKTAETGLTIANTDIKLSANGAAAASKNSGGGTHLINGHYAVTFDATDTATVGELSVSCVVAGALPVFDKWTVVEEAVYDALFASSALGYVANAPVNVAQFGGSNGTFSGGRPEVNTTHAAGTAWGSGAITAASIAADAITAAKLHSDVTTELQSGLATEASLATVATYIDTEVAAIKAVTDLLPDAGALTSLATAAAMATVDTVVDAIKAKTDSLTFTVAGQVDANIQYVNDVQVTGDGQTGTEWGPA